VARLRVIYSIERHIRDDFVKGKPVVRRGHKAYGPDTTKGGRAAEDLQAILSSSAFLFALANDANIGGANGLLA